MQTLETDPSPTNTFSQIAKAIENFSFSMQPREIGLVTSVATGIAKVSGLPHVGFEELLQFQNGLLELLIT